MGLCGPAIRDHRSLANEGSFSLENGIGLMEQASDESTSGFVTPISAGSSGQPGAFAFCILRSLTVTVATTPRILPDESASWAFSRFVAGGASIITMHEQPECRFGTDLVLSPLWAVTSDPTLRCRLGLVLLSAAPILAAWRIARSLRLFRLGDNVLRSTSSALVLLFPATIMTSSFTWAGPW
ncbi:hypothetical protein IMCC26207_10327 [Actinobacteria bacterium IMCC26207]|nr:hypothetical protein IMCC26207_10327 [Actinobacteria bacterium IMCC26207]